MSGNTPDDYEHDLSLTAQAAATATQRPLGRRGRAPQPFHDPLVERLVARACVEGRLGAGVQGDHGPGVCRCAEQLAQGGAA